MKKRLPLARLLCDAIDGDRYPLSPRVQTLKAILAKIRPEPVREPLPVAKALYRRARQQRDGGAAGVRIENRARPADDAR